MAINGFEINGAELNGAGFSTVFETISEDVSIDDTVGVVMTAANETIAEDTSVSHAFAQSLTFFLSEAVVVDDTAAAVAHAALQEGISILHTSLPTLFTADSVSEAVVIDDILNILLNGIISEDLTLDDLNTAIPTYITLVAEQLSASDINTTVLQASNIVLAGMLLSDIISHAMLETLAEVVNVSDIVAESAKRLELFIEALTIADTQGELNSVTGIITSSLTISETLTPAQVLSIALSEGIVMMSLPNKLGGEYTGWVLNPETFSIWNYSNYNFTSMTTLNDNTYMVNDSGLFKMGGTTDNLANITSRIKTAGIDAGTSSLKNFPEIYLGIQSDGEVVVVVKTDERLEVMYKVNTVTSVQDMQYVKLGKGLEGSTWQFELIDNNATQFDLRGIELYPVVYGRKRR